MSEQDEPLTLTPEERVFLQRVVDRELGYLQDNRRREELSERRAIAAGRQEQVARAVADRLAGPSDEERRRRDYAVETGVDG